MSPIVSVVIPTYNRAGLVVQAIDSVLDQTYRDFEVIVIDDGSTDDTKDRLVEYCDEVNYVQQPNRGVNAARNHGVSLARGKYIALLDDDDVWLKAKLHEQITLLDRHPNAGFVFSDFFIWRSNGERVPNGLHTWHAGSPDWNHVCPRCIRVESQGRSDKGETAYDARFGDIYAASLRAPYVLPSTAVIRRSCIASNLIFNECDSTCGDWEFFARLSKSSGAVFMDVETALNRSHEDAVRLTRLPRKVQLSRRLAMVRRTWKADVDFYSTHRRSVDDVERRLLLDLALAQALEGDASGSRMSLNERSHIPGRSEPREKVIGGLLRIPGGPTLIRKTRELRNRMAESRH